MLCRLKLIIDEVKIMKNSKLLITLLVVESEDEMMPYDFLNFTMDIPKGVFLDESINDNISTFREENGDFLITYIASEGIYQQMLDNYNSLNSSVEVEGNLTIVHVINKGTVEFPYSNVVLVPKETNNLSKNTNQLDNDRFFAHYNMLLDYYKDLDKDVAATIYMKALSANWKYVKKNLNHPYWTADFFRYIKAKVLHPQPDFAFLEQLGHRFLSLENVLRSKGE